MMTRTVQPVERLRLERPNDIYLGLHAPRYKLLLKLLGRFVSPSARVLDIGRSSLSTMIAQQFGVTVDTLGFAPDEQTDIGRHWKFDLNDAQFPERWRSDIGPYDLIVMAEVIEHIHTSPSLVLRFLKHLISESGILVIQTAATSLLKLGTQIVDRAIPGDGVISQPVS